MFVGGVQEDGDDFVLDDGALDAGLECAVVEDGVRRCG